MKYGIITYTHAVCMCPTHILLSRRDIRLFFVSVCVTSANCVCDDKSASRIIFYTKYSKRLSLLRWHVSSGCVWHHTHTHTQTHTHTPSRAQSKSSQPRRHSQIYKSFARCSFCLCQLAVALCLSLVAFCYVCDYLHAVMPVIGGMLYDVSCDWLHAVRCYICDWGHAVMPVIGGMPLCLWLAACFMPVIGCMLCDISCVKYNA